jgi:hypothetical protein
MTHEWGHVVFSTWWGRPFLYTVKITASICIVPLALLVSNEAYVDHDVKK